MMAEKISRAIGEIDDKYIEEAASFSRSKKQIFMRRVCALAACLAIIVGTVFSGNFLYLFSQAPGGFTLIDTHKKSFFDFSFGAEKRLRKGSRCSEVHARSEAVRSIISSVISTERRRFANRVGNMLFSAPNKNGKALPSHFCLRYRSP